MKFLQDGKTYMQVDEARKLGRLITVAGKPRGWMQLISMFAHVPGDWRHVTESDVPELIRQGARLESSVAPM